MRSVITADFGEAPPGERLAPQTAAAGMLRYYGIAEAAAEQLEGAGDGFETELVAAGRSGRAVFDNLAGGYGVYPIVTSDGSALQGLVITGEEKVILVMELSELASSYWSVDAAVTCASYRTPQQ